MCVMLLQATHPLQQQKPPLHFQCKCWSQMPRWIQFSKQVSYHSVKSVTRHRAATESHFHCRVLPLYYTRGWGGTQRRESLVCCFLSKQEKPPQLRTTQACVLQTCLGQNTSARFYPEFYFRNNKKKRKSQKSFQWADNIEPPAAAVTTSPAGDKIQTGTRLNAIAHSQSSGGAVVLNMKLVFFFFYLLLHTSSVIV